MLDGAPIARGCSPLSHPRGLRGHVILACAALACTSVIAIEEQDLGDPSLMRRQRGSTSQSAKYMENARHLGANSERHVEVGAYGDNKSEHRVGGSGKTSFTERLVQEPAADAVDEGSPAQIGDPFAEDTGPNPVDDIPQLELAPEPEYDETTGLPKGMRLSPTKFQRELFKPPPAPMNSTTPAPANASSVTSENGGEQYDGPPVSKAQFSEPPSFQILPSDVVVIKGDKKANFAKTCVQTGTHNKGEVQCCKFDMGKWIPVTEAAADDQMIFKDAFAYCEGKGQRICLFDDFVKSRSKIRDTPAPLWTMDACAYSPPSEKPYPPAALRKFGYIVDKLEKREIEINDQVDMIWRHANQASKLEEMPFKLNRRMHDVIVQDGWNVAVQSTKHTLGRGNVIVGTDNDVSSATNAFVAGKYNVVKGDGVSVAGGAYNVASGNFSSVLGGKSSRAIGTYSTIGGGTKSVANGEASTVGGGRGNTASGKAAVVMGGVRNEAEGEFTVVAGGSYNTATGESSKVQSGSENQAIGIGSGVGGGKGRVNDEDHENVGGGGSEGKGKDTKGDDEVIPDDSESKTAEGESASYSGSKDASSGKKSEGPEPVPSAASPREEAESAEGGGRGG